MTVAATANPTSGKGLLIGTWVARIAVAGILLMTGIVKFTPQADDLVAALDVSRFAVMAIGIIEIATAVLIVLPKTTIIGAGMTIVTMLGALGAHFVGPLGTSSDDPVGSMWPMAVVVLLAAITSLVLHLKQRPGTGGA